MLEMLRRLDRGMDIEAAELALLQHADNAQLLAKAAKRLPVNPSIQLPHEIGEVLLGPGRVEPGSAVAAMVRMLQRQCDVRNRAPVARIEPVLRRLLKSLDAVGISAAIGAPVIHATPNSFAPTGTIDLCLFMTGGDPPKHRRRVVLGAEQATWRNFRGPDPWGPVQCAKSEPEPLTFTVSSGSIALSPPRRRPGFSY